MEHEFQDPYIRYLKNIPKPPIGLTKLDYSRVLPGPNIVHTREMTKFEEFRFYKRDGAELLCRGGAVGLDEDGVCRHIWPCFSPQLFCGFVMANHDRDRVYVMSQGRLFLRLPGVTRLDVGKPVFAHGPNDFSLGATEHCVEIGVVRFIQPDTSDRASVSFMRWNLDAVHEVLRIY